MIEFKKISKKYEKKVVISDLSMTIKNNELVVLIGSSGCGKTSILKMINKLIKPSSGKILIDGIDISKINSIELRRGMGYVIQQTGLFPHMTIRENIEIISRLEKQEKNSYEKKCKEMMDMVGLEPNEFLDRYPMQLSGGQQQRIGVARAFMNDPKIILMDEPFSALDPITKSQIQDELVDLQNKLKKTIVFVTHDMDEAIKIADRICLLDGGKIVQYDIPEEIMKNPTNDFVESFIAKNRIWSSPEFIKAKDIMIQNPICTFGNVSVFKCIEKMRIQKVDTLLIIDKNYKLLGMVSAKQIQKIKNKDILVSEIMVSDYISILENENIINILSFVNEKDLSAIPVLDPNKELKGLITKSSLVTTLSHQFIDSEEVI